MQIKSRPFAECGMILANEAVLMKAVVHYDSMSCMRGFLTAVDRLASRKDYLESNCEVLKEFSLQCCGSIRVLPLLNISK